MRLSTPSPAAINLWLAVSLYSYGCEIGNKTEFRLSATLREEEFQENPIINWDAILWVNRPPELWAVQLLLAMVSLTEALLIAYLSYKVRHAAVKVRSCVLINQPLFRQGNIWQQILSFHFILELVTTVPFLFTVRCSSSFVTFHQ